MAVPFRLLFKGLYKRCQCGYCNDLIPIINSVGNLARFKSGHNSKDNNHPNWKGGRTKSKGYWYIKIPNYFSSDTHGYIREHIYIYQEYNHLSMLKWGVVHHLDFNKTNNSIENLQGMTKWDHMKLHMKGNDHSLNKHKDVSDRRCHSCRSNKTYIANPSGLHKTNRQRWYHLSNDKINWYCYKCYQRLKKANL